MKRNGSARAEVEREALDRAVNGQSATNYPAIYQGFAAMGIPEDQILPRENVLTYHAWRARGRQVRKGEHGVKVCTWVPVTKETRDESTGEIKIEGFRRPKTAVVFHVSQTVEVTR